MFTPIDKIQPALIGTKDVGARRGPALLYAFFGFAAGLVPAQTQVLPNGQPRSGLQLRAFVAGRGR